jgi:hypothetical protein
MATNSNLTNNSTNNGSLIVDIEMANIIKDATNMNTTTIVANQTSTTTSSSEWTTTPPRPSTADQQQLQLFESNCLEIEHALHSRPYQIIMHVNMVLLAITLVAIAVLVRRFSRQPVPVHSNLLVSIDT